MHEPRPEREPFSAQQLIRKVVARDRSEHHRASTPLELLFDLCFVVAIAQASARLHHGIGEAHFLAAARGFALVFFAIWWAWVNFTWYASAYDNDDVPYRLTTLVVIAGVLVMAAGVPRAFDTTDFTIPTIGYTIMRVGLVSGWLRAAHADNQHRRTAQRYALGLAVVQLGWLALLFLPRSSWIYGFVVLAPIDVLLPWWAERVGTTTWHAQHIGERYGLMTILVLGESILATTLAIQAGLDAGVSTPRLLGVAAGGLLIVFSMWWLYFDQSAHRFLTSNRIAFFWGYGHYVIFGSCAAVGAGLAASVEAITGHGHLPPWAQGAPVAVPVALYVTSVWLLHVRPLRCGWLLSGSFVATPVLVLACSPLTWAVPAIGVVMALLVTVVIFTPALKAPR